jgi:hypothetical protein
MRLQLLQKKKKLVVKKKRNTKRADGEGIGMPYERRKREMMGRSQRSLAMRERKRGYECD